MARSTAQDPGLRLTLTPRQGEILQLIQRGLTNGQIAEQLGLSLDGVKWHVREILARLEVESREEAAAVWREQNRRAWVKRAVRGLVPVGVSLRIAVGGLAVAGSIAGGGVLLATLITTDNATGPAGVASEGRASATAELSPTAFPTADPATACVAGDLSIGSDSKLENGALVYEARITKPRGCDLTGPIDVFVVEDAAAGFQGARLLTERAGLVAPVGTDRVFVSVTWQNWCRAVPTPGPTVERVPGGVPDFPPSNSLWVAWSAMSGGGTGHLYPACTSPTTPTTLSIATRSEPDPPAVAAPIASAPRVASPADLDSFARWFATVIGSRDEAVLAVLSKPVAAICPAAVPSGPYQRYPLCTEARAGQTVTGFVMDQSGSLGDDDAFRTQLNRVTAGSGRLRAAGCAIDAPACERFVVAFEAVPRSGPGNYQAYVFEAVEGVSALRGFYPGGGDRGTVFAGGLAITPWGQVSFVPLP